MGDRDTPPAAAEARAPHARPLRRALRQELQLGLLRAVRRQERARAAATSPEPLLQAAPVHPDRHLCLAGALLGEEVHGVGRVDVGGGVEAVAVERREDRVHELLRQLQPKARVDHRHRQILQQRALYWCVAMMN